MALLYMVKLKIPYTDKKSNKKNTLQMQTLTHNNLLSSVVNYYFVYKPSYN